MLSNSSARQNASRQPGHSSRRSSMFATSHSALFPQSTTMRTSPPSKPDPAATLKNQQQQQQASRQKNMIIVKFVYSRELKLAVEKLAAEKLIVAKLAAEKLTVAKLAAEKLTVEKLLCVSGGEWGAENYDHHQPSPVEPNMVHGFPIVLYRVREIADIIEERERLRQERLARLRELQQRMKREKLLQKQRKRGAKVSNKAAAIESKTSLTGTKARGNTKTAK